MKKLKLTQETVDKIRELMPVCRTARQVAAMINVREDVVSAVKHENYTISDEAVDFEVDKEGCFSWKDYPRGCY